MAGRVGRGRWVVCGLALLVIVALALIARPLLHLARTAVEDRPEPTETRPGAVDDASRMNETAVRSIVHAPDDPAEAERVLVDLIRQAGAEGLPVAIAGARHTMGGHTIAPDGIVIDMLPLAQMALDEERGVLTVGAGAVWSDVLSYLDARGWSIEVMQSNNSFSVGGSISANCHGWQIARPPIASTVRSFRLLMADGDVRRCSREENAELFGLALGGYGLFGVILDVELDVIPNELYRGERHRTAAESLVSILHLTALDREDAAMAYARLCVVPDEMFRDALVTVFYRVPRARDDPPLPPLTEPGLISLKRAVFRGSVDSDYGKALRWQAERMFGSHLAARTFTRNQLLNEGVDVYRDGSADTTDILHEYFVPPEQFSTFLNLLHSQVIRFDADLLNATVRHLMPDEDTVLRYADREMISIVLLFSQERTEEADLRMREMTRSLIEGTLRLEGRYYLPYRLHATEDQFRRAYPGAEEFFERKRFYDPGEVFRNQFYLTYGRADTVPPPDPR